MTKNKSKLNIAAGFIAASVLVFASCSKEKIAVNAVNESANNNLTEIAVASSNMVANQALVKFRKGTPANAKNDAFARISAKTEELIFTKTMETAGETET